MVSLSLLAVESDTVFPNHDTKVVKINKNRDIMARKAIYDACCREIQRRGLKTMNGRMRRPDLRSLFGKELVVNQREFEVMSKCEQLRHLQEDEILSFLYLEDKSYGGMTIKE